MQPVESDCRAPWEWPTLLVIFAVFLLLNVVTASRSPTVWMDEVMLADPAASLYLGQGFHSAASPYLTNQETYVSNALPYTAALYGWINIFGFNPTAVRSLNFALMVLTVAMICLAVQRYRLVRSPQARIVLACLLLCGYGIAFSFRSGRYDISAAIVVAAMFLAGTVRQSGLRYSLLAILGALAMWAGMQMTPLLFVLGLLLLIFFGARFLMPLIVLALGSIAGLLSMYLAFRANGQWSTFIRTTRAFAGSDVVNRGLVHRTIAAVAAALRGLVLHDFSLTILLLLMAMALLVMIVGRKWQWRSAPVFGLAVAVLVPLAMFFAGRYPIYYSWMAFLPATVAAVAAWDTLLRSHQHAAIRRASAALLVLACLVGLPLRLTLTALEWNQRSYAPVEQLVQRNVTSTDYAYCDPAAYYPTKRIAALTFVGTYAPMMSPREKSQVSVLIIDPANFDAVQQTVGGDWRDTGQRLPPITQPNLFGLRGQVGAKLYSLAIYRRAGLSN